jgi:hypothetical protein
MSYERNYNENGYNHHYNHFVENNNDANNNANNDANNHANNYANHDANNHVNNDASNYTSNYTSNDNIEMNNADRWRLTTLYVDTKYVYAAKTHDEVLTSDKLFAQQNRPQTHPSCLPVILKDTSRPYTYYTSKSYGNAQENNYYVNFDDHVSGGSSAQAMPSHYNNNNNNNNNNSFETESNASLTFENSGCVRTYLCTLFGCFACCLIHFKPC